MSWSYRLLTPRLVEEDLAIAELRTETRLALQTLRTLLERPDSVDEGVVRGQIDAALQDPSMAQSLLHRLFRTDDTRDLHTLYAAMDSIEQQMVARQRASRQDVRTMLQFIRTVLLTPMHHDRPTLRQDMVETLLTSFQASKVPSTDDLSAALHRLTLAPTTMTAHVPAASVGVSASSSATSSPTSHIASQIGGGTQTPNPGAAGVPANVLVPSPISPPPSFPSVGNGTHASAFVALGPSPQGGGMVAAADATNVSNPSHGAVGPSPLPSPGRASTSPTFLAAIQAIGTGSLSPPPPPTQPSPTQPDENVLSWLHNLNDQMGGVSPAPTPPSSSVTSDTWLPVVHTFHVVRVTQANECTADAVAERCGIEAADVAQCWSMHHPFDMTPSPGLWANRTGAICVQVPVTSVGSTDVHTFETRLVSRHFGEEFEWTHALHTCLMDLLACTTATEPSTDTAPVASTTPKPTQHARSQLRAPGPPPSTMTDRHVCLQQVFEGVDVDACILRQVPLLRLRRVHSRAVLEWCIIIKPLDANGHLRVFRLNNKPNNRYVSVAPADLYIALDTSPVPYHGHYLPPAQCLQTGTHATDNGAPPLPDATNGGPPPFVYTHALEVLDDMQIRADDNRLRRTEFTVHPTARPSKLYTPNMFGGNLRCGWYSELAGHEHDVRMYVFHAAPRTVYVHREVTKASV
jgi:hypothetical protein